MLLGFTTDFTGTGLTMSSAIITTVSKYILITKGVGQ